MQNRVILPIDAFEGKIVETVLANPVTVLVAETGAGKSTRVPQMLLSATGYEIVVTQPRRIAAKSVAKRVAEEVGCVFGSTVGFRTAVDRNDSKDTRCLFCTDGLQLVREMTASKQTVGNGIVLILDEVHEWNQNIETIVAWCKQQIVAGTDVKVVLMSATLDAKALSQYFNNAPIINVPGRCYPVVGSPIHPDGMAQVSADSMVDEIMKRAKDGRNTLVFLPGKGEIQQMQDALKAKSCPAVVFPLHGQVDPKEQDKVFRSYSKGKVILATNIAQTSVTISDINSVVDSGQERRIVLRNGVETLILGNISKADIKQRAGRAGRVQEGDYVLCNNSMYDNFSEYPIPEILRTRLDQMLLRLAGTGIDATKLPFFHQPDMDVLLEAKQTLKGLGALDSDGAITKMGFKINKFPTSVIAARMIIEATKRNCLGPILTIASILSTNYGSITRRKRNDDPSHFVAWTNHLDPSKEYKSDLLAELDLYELARGFKRNQLAQKGISPKGFGTAIETRQQIAKALRGLRYNVGHHNTNASNEEEILKCIAAGMVHHLYQNQGGDSYKNGESVYRTIDRESLLNKLSYWPKWLVGTPKNITFTNRRGYEQTFYLVNSVTEVKPEWMSEVAPHMVETLVEAPKWNAETDEVTCDHVTKFNGVEILRESKPAEFNDEAFNIFVEKLVTGYFYSDDFDWFTSFRTEAKDAIDAYQLYYAKGAGLLPSVSKDETLRKMFSLLKDDCVLSMADLRLIWARAKDELKAVYTQLLSDEDRETIDEIANQKVILNGKEHEIVKYSHYSGDEFRAYVHLPEDYWKDSELLAGLIENVESGHVVYYYIGASTYYSYSAADIRRKAEDKVSSQWDSFSGTHGSQSIESEDDFLTLSEPKVWNQITGEIAYQGYSYREGDRSYYIKWYKTETEANQATETVKAIVSAKRAEIKAETEKREKEAKARAEAEDFRSYMRYDWESETEVHSISEDLPKITEIHNWDDSDASRTAYVGYSFDSDLHYSGVKDDDRKYTGLKWQKTLYRTVEERDEAYTEAVQLIETMRNANNIAEIRNSFQQFVNENYELKSELEDFSFDNGGKIKQQYKEFQSLWDRTDNALYDRDPEGATMFNDLKKALNDLQEEKRKIEEEESKPIDLGSINLGKLFGGR